MWTTGPLLYRAPAFASAPWLHCGLEHAGLSAFRAFSLHCSALTTFPCATLPASRNCLSATCSQLPSFVSLGALPALAVLNMPWCQALTSPGPLSGVPRPALKELNLNHFNLRLTPGAVPLGPTCKRPRTPAGLPQHSASTGQSAKGRRLVHGR